MGSAPESWSSLPGPLCPCAAQGQAGERLCDGMEEGTYRERHSVEKTNGVNRIQAWSTDLDNFPMISADIYGHTIQSCLKAEFLA